MPDRVTVLVVDGHACSAHGVAMALQRQARIELIGVAQSFQDVPAEPTPNTLVLDHTTLDAGFDAIGQAQDLFPGVRVIVHTASAAVLDVHRAIWLGARAYVCKQQRLDALMAAVELVAAECIVVPSSLAAMLRPPTNCDSLSPFDLEMLRYVADGAGNAQIANQLHLSISSVKRRIASIECRLNARNRIEAARKAVEMGIV